MFIFYILVSSCLEKFQFIKLYGPQGIEHQSQAESGYNISHVLSSKRFWYFGRKENIIDCRKNAVSSIDLLLKSCMTASENILILHGVRAADRTAFENTASRMETAFRTYLSVS